MLRFMLKNRLPEEFNEDSKVTLSADQAFLQALEKMNERAMTKRLPDRREVIDVVATDAT